MKTKRITMIVAIILCLAALLLAPSFAMASEVEEPIEAVDMVTVENSDNQSEQDEPPEQGEQTEHENPPEAPEPAEQGDEHEHEAKSAEYKGKIIGFAAGEHAYHDYKELSTLAEAEALALTPTLQLRVEKEDGSVEVETVSVEWITVHAEPYNSNSECGVYCYEAIPLDEGYAVDEFYAPTRIVIVGEMPQPMKLMSQRSGAVLSRDINGTAYAYDTTYAVYTGFAGGGSREEFNTANNYDGFYCHTCGNGGGGEGGGTPNTCTAPRIWVRGITNSGNYYQIYHRHWTNMQDSGHAVWILPVGNPYFSGWYTASDTVAPSAPRLTANVSTSISNWTKNNVIISASGSTDSGTRLTQGMTSPDNAGKGLSHYEYSDTGGAWQGLPANASASVVQTATFSTSGAHEITVRAVDKARNASGVSTAYAYIDKTAPSVTLTPSTTAANVPSVSVTIMATDEHSGVKSITSGSNTLFNASSRVTSKSESIEFSQNGTYSFTVTDNVGQAASKSITITNIDAVPPRVVSATQTPDWERVSKPVTVTATDNVGVAKYGYDTSAAGTDITWSDESVLQIPANGEWYVFAQDFAGNVSQPVGITVDKIDCVLPVATHELTPAVWCNTNVAVTVTASDMPEYGTGIISGLDRIALADGTTARNTTGAATFTASFVAENNGTYRYTVYDVAGNSRTYEAVVSNIDRQIPDTVTISKSVNNDVWTADDVQIDIDAADTPSDVYGLSGVKTITLPNESVVDNISGINAMSASYTARRNGDYTFTVADNAGNTHGFAVNVANIDKTPPTAEHTLTPDIWTSTDVQVDIHADDEQSGVEKIILPDGTEVAGDDASFTADENGTYEVELVDNVGNSVVIEIEVGIIDRTAPSLLLSAYTIEWTNGTVTLTARAYDAQSGVSFVTKPDGSTMTGSTASFIVSDNGVYEFKATDNAGNVGTAQITVSNIDRVPPDLTLFADTAEWTNTPVPIRASASDAQSGVRGISLPDTTVVASPSTVYSARMNGRYVFVAMDNAGNTTTRYIQIDNIDTTPPDIDTEIDPDEDNDGETTVDIIADDGESGVDQIELPDGSKVNSDTAEYTFTESGEYIITARDKAGNVATQRVKVVVVAKESPIEPKVTEVEDAISVFDFLCVLATLVMLVIVLFRKRDEDVDGDSDDNTNDARSNPNRNKLIIAAAIFAGSALLFILTQPMVPRFKVFDWWSLLFGALAVGDGFALKKCDENDETKEEEEEE